MVLVNLISCCNQQSAVYHILLVGLGNAAVSILE
jgi:hypothetical protein